MNLILPASITQLIDTITDNEQVSRKVTTVKQPLPEINTIVLRDGNGSLDTIEERLADFDLRNTRFQVYIHDRVSNKALEGLLVLPHIDEMTMYVTLGRTSKTQDNTMQTVAEHPEIFRKIRDKLEVFGLQKLDSDETKPEFPLQSLIGFPGCVTIHGCRLSGNMSSTKTARCVTICACDYSATGQTWSGMNTDTKLIIHGHDSKLLWQGACVCHQVELHHVAFESKDQLKLFQSAYSVRFEWCSFDSGVDVFGILYQVVDLQFRYIKAEIIIRPSQNTESAYRCRRLVVKKTKVANIKRLNELQCLETDEYKPDELNGLKLNMIQYKIRGSVPEIDLTRTAAQTVYVCKTDVKTLRVPATTDTIVLNKATVHSISCVTESKPSKSKGLLVRIVDYGHVIQMPENTRLHHECQTKCLANELGIHSVYEFRAIRHESTIPEVKQPEVKQPEVKKSSPVAE